MDFIKNIFSKPDDKIKVGISLSGGGVRGIAHLGVLKALNENDIFPEIVSGVSAGALVGVFYCDGYKPEEILQIFRKTHFFNFARLTVPRTGFMTMYKVEKILKEKIRAKKFKDLKIPLTVAASNLNDGIIEYFSEGDLIDKIIASASIPVLFKPRIINDKTYVDGGILDNLPVHPIRKKCDKLIASHVNPLSKENDLNSMLDIAERTFHLSIASSVQKNAKESDLFIEPEELIKHSLLKMENIDDIFSIGYESTKRILKKNTVF